MRGTERRGESDVFKGSSGERTLFLVIQLRLARLLDLSHGYGLRYDMRHPILQ